MLAFRSANAQTETLFAYKHAVEHDRNSIRKTTATLHTIIRTSFFLKQDYEKNLQTLQLHFIDSLSLLESSIDLS